MIKKHTLWALLLIIAVIGSYVVHFYFYLEYELSEKVSDWVGFSSFIGGLIGPILSFFSFVLLLRSLELQNATSSALRAESEQSRKREKLTSFETQFYNLIDAQRQVFENFKISFEINNKIETYKKVEAVTKIEDLIENMRERGCSVTDIESYIEQIDANENIFNLVRIFRNIVRLIEDKLADSEGFTSDERHSFNQTLISFTEFSQLRLVILCMQFLDYPATNYLKNNCEFTKLLEELGLEKDPY